MKAASILLSLLLTATCSTAQTTLQNSQLAPEVVILEFSSHRNFRRPDWDRSAAYRMMGGILVRQQQEVRKEYVYEVTIQNNSRKSIKRIDWDYVFIDPATQEEVARHRFHHSEEVCAGKKRSLVATSISPQTRVVRVEATTEKPLRPLQEKVVLQSITYADGTVWKQPSEAQNGR